MIIWDDLRAVGFDFEASGTLPEYALQPWRLKTNDFWTTSISVIHRQGPQLMPWMGKLFPTIEDMRLFLETAIANDWIVVGWNILYDVAVLIAYGLRDLVFQVRWIDGLLLWKHLEIDPEYDIDKPKKRAYRLKPDAVARWIPGFADTTGADDVDFHSTDPAELAKLQHYNNRDSVRALVISKMIWDHLTEKQRNAAVIEAEAIPLVAEANFNGMPVDELFANELAAWLQGTAEERLEQLKPHGLTGAAMVRSPKQLEKLIFDVWGLPVYKENTGKKTGKTSRSTDKEVLHELAFADPRCKLIKEYREALNNDTKFAKAPVVSAQYHGDGCTRPQGIMFGTYTGRMTYASKQGKNKDERQIGFALHQEKRGKEFRGILQAPPGYTLVEFDAAGQEYRWMAALSGDPNMLQLCMPGEDAHSFMGARVGGLDYRDLIRLVAEEDKKAEQIRYLGKVANLCIAEGTTILTDRGPCNIEQVRDDDLVWDGEQFVAHDGVSFSGVNEVITYMGVTATLDHKVLLTDGRGHDRWDEIEAAARHGWQIKSALGERWAHRARSAVRIVDGVVRRALRQKWRALRAGPLWMWTSSRCEFTFSGGGPIRSMQELRDAHATPTRGQGDIPDSRREARVETRQRVVPAMPQPQGQVVSQLRRAWDRVQVHLGPRWGRVHHDAPAAPGLPEAGHRPDQQRRSLRAWKLALGYARGEPCESRQVRTYDIVNCGPNTRFAANGLIVHNSLQYRTYPKTFRKVARVQYDIPLELPDAQRIHRTYQQTYRHVPTYWEQAIDRAKRAGYAETLAGRRVALTGDWGGSLSWKMESTALNYPVQGTGGDQKYLALRALKSFLVPERCYFAWDLHDGLYWWVPDKIVDRVTVEGKAMLDSLPYQEAWGYTPPIPMPWDCKYGKSWGTQRKLEEA